MLIQTDPFRDLESWMTGSSRRSSGATLMPLDSYRRGDDVWVHIDLPGMAADSIDIDVERSVLTVSAERNWQGEESDQIYLTERRRGQFRRQLHLGEGLDAASVEADYHDGVLTLRIPVAEQAKPRKVEVNTRPAIDVESAEA